MRGTLRLLQSAGSSHSSGAPSTSGVAVALPLKERIQVYASGVQAYISEFTGYVHVEGLKEQESKYHTEFLVAREKLKELSKNYEGALKRRTSTQSQLNGLLNRRLEWNPDDAEHFARLNTDDMFLKSKEGDAKAALDHGMERVEQLQTRWLRAVEQHRKQELAYVENSRQLGTYASLALLSLNTLMFAANFLLLEPYKLRRIKSVVEVSRDEVVEKLEERRRDELGSASGQEVLAQVNEKMQAMQERHIALQQQTEAKVSLALENFSKAMKEMQIPNGASANEHTTGTLSPRNSAQEGKGSLIDITSRKDLVTLCAVASIAGVVSGTVCVALMGLLRKS